MYFVLRKRKTSLDRKNNKQRRESSSSRLRDSGSSKYTIVVVVVILSCRGPCTTVLVILLIFDDVPRSNFSTNSRVDAVPSSRVLLLARNLEINSTDLQHEFETQFHSEFEL